MENNITEPSLKKIKEVVLIEAIKKRFKPMNKDVIVPIGDDTAVVRGGKGKCLLYTADMLIEGVHFKKGEDPKKIGYKAMAVSVSDIAAMGGEPKYALVSVGLPQKNVDKTARGLYDGIRLCAKKFSIDVIGGDTNRSQKLVIDCFMAGVVEAKRLVLRSTAKPGDFIFVSGPLGGSLEGRHLSFEPRVKEARFLVENFRVSSMIDLSDGLGTDLNRVAGASKTGALIFENKIPVSRGVKTIRAALFDGEDFELLFTLPKLDAFKLLGMMNARRAPFKFFSVGRMTDLFNGVRMVTADGRIKQIPCAGFKHF
ncbi:MAG: thiamine-monophosphate kinase [Candidatus Omnitrophica bacterium]|nr:thiamine-monophosphate kinase [Candidatus Omnitrophota bacterium]